MRFEGTSDLVSSQLTGILDCSAMDDGAPGARYLKPKRTCFSRQGKQMTMQGQYSTFKHGENLCWVLALICELPFSLQRKLKRSLELKGKRGLWTCQVCISRYLLIEVSRSHTVG